LDASVADLERLFFELTASGETEFDSDFDPYNTELAGATS
jgi:hypothetical protein